ncbi:unnamed protein product [Anisakis simplex]|uniref:Acyl-CoA synthetase family member 4 (inferred by orthology to a human protein) n=1 Tax=Anisakis simplex TaxID=6269 RepID=A0A0M3J332_ANISI|nr:unnamed protein product [Anisakis simplex]
MTPSLLKLIPRSYLMKMFDENSSSIRILLLGGEAFPSEKEEVDIGEPLLDTTFNISDEGELLIGGPRKCYVNGVITDDDWVATGDLVERLEDGRIVWRGRLDDQVKLNGIRVNLMEITSEVQHLGEVDSALAIHWRKQAIILFVKMRGQLNDIDAYLQKHITSKWLFPSVVFAINEWPLNEHGNNLILNRSADNSELKIFTLAFGKIDRDGLLEIFKERNCSVKRENVTAVLAEYGIDVDKNKFDSLHSLGMTSLCATELMFKFEHLIEKEDFELLQFLLSETATVSDLLQLLQADNVTFDSTAKMKLESKEIIRISPRCDQYETSLVWEWDSGACIDATPIIHNRNVFIGSHSGRFASIRIDDGHVNWEVKLANRIEATANLQDGVIAVGNHFI